jgi:hypothetical protein
MKPHEQKKQVQNKSEKEGGKQRVIKKPNQKRRKDNKTLSQKSEDITPARVFLMSPRLCIPPPVYHAFLISSGSVSSRSHISSYLEIRCPSLVE